MEGLFFLFMLCGMAGKGGKEEKGGDRKERGLGGMFRQK